jgi:hypothetical protein
MSQHDDPDSTRPVPSVRQSHRPAALVTETGEHPAIVLQPESKMRFIAGLSVDLCVIICITVLILFGKISAEAGLPWIALLAGAKAGQMRRGTGSGGGALGSILGIGGGVIR